MGAQGYERQKMLATTQAADYCGRRSAPLRKLVKLNPDGSTEGVDPRTVSPDDLRNAGHDDRSMSQAIRAKCLDCSNDQPSEVRRCTATGCKLWPYRMGTNPFAKARGSGKPFSRDREGKVPGVKRHQELPPLRHEELPPPLGS